MSGETEENVSGWTTDTLHTHMQKQIDACTMLARTLNDALKEMSQRQLTELSDSIDRELALLQAQIERRFERESKAVDVAFGLHREVTRDELANADRALQAAMIAAEKAVSAALASAEKAVDKAEQSNEKRFASVNEFREQLREQASRFISRSEVEARIQSVVERLDNARDDRAKLEAQANEQFARVNSRLDTGQGTVIGAASEQANRQKTTALLIAFGSLLLTIIAVATAILVATGRG